MLWLAIDLVIAFVSVMVLGVLTLALWRQVKRTKADVGVLNGLAAQASDAMATISR